MKELSRDFIRYSIQVILASFAGSRKIMVLTRQSRQVSSSVLPFLPLFLRAPVVQGKRRGGKELGIPTGMYDTKGIFLSMFINSYNAPDLAGSLGVSLPKQIGW